MIFWPLQFSRFLDSRTEDLRYLHGWIHFLLQTLQFIKERRPGPLINLTLCD
ncbi:hypothetical protein Zm00014a_042908 [Zea mays]|uniref:Uncharacterized protein n=1 Tax=Zea mays TaxID=4577 RepID=A0A3L6F215_MAIZE|nr:hypothetical protein Zm00014a_042908 [Zea mays]